MDSKLGNIILTSSRWLLVSLLTIVLLVSVAIAIGYHLVDKRLQQYGVSDWQISFQKVTVNHLVIDQLSLSYRPAKLTDDEQSAESSMSSKTLAEWLMTPIPDYIPEQISINELRLQLPNSTTAIVASIDYQAEVLTVELQSPYSLNAELQRQQSTIIFDARGHQQQVQARYDIVTGELVADAQVNVPSDLLNPQLPSLLMLQQPIATQLSWTGSLDLHQAAPTFAGIVNQLSGELVTKSRKPMLLELQANGAAAMLEAEIELSATISNGVLGQYQADSNGIANKVTLADLPQPLETVSWQLKSSDKLALSLDKWQQLSQQLDYPLTGSFTVNNTLRLNHATQWSANSVDSAIEIEPFDWQQTPFLQALLAEHLPQALVQEATVSADANLIYDLQGGDWRLADSVVQLNGVNGVYQTVAISQANLTLPLEADPQHIAVNNAKVNAEQLSQGFIIGPISARFDANVPLNDLPETALTLHDHSISALGGDISIPNQRYSLNDTISVPIVFERLSLSRLMEQYPTDKITIDGSVSGTLPLVWDSNTLSVNRGHLTALAPGGRLTVDPSLLAQSVGSNPSLNTMVNVLENFHYQHLSSFMDYSQQGTLRLELQLRGNNPDVQDGREVNLNINLEEDLPALIKGLQLSNSLNDVIRQRVQDSIE